jgi:hypothetical protein
MTQAMKLTTHALRVGTDGLSQSAIAHTPDRLAELGLSPHMLCDV